MTDEFASNVAQSFPNTQVRAEVKKIIEMLMAMGT
jgi:hypothetical protein